MIEESAVITNETNKGETMPINPINTFAEKVIKKFSKEITDQVFLMIENDKDLNQEYLRLVSNKKLDTVNQTIGKMVRKKFNLESTTTRQEKPKSKFIKSHVELKPR
jgi:hypothetical protein